MAAINEVVKEYYATYGYNVTPWMEDGFPEYLQDLMGEAEEPAMGTLRKRRKKPKTMKVEPKKEQGAGVSSDSTLAPQGPGST